MANGFKETTFDSDVMAFLRNCANTMVHNAFKNNGKSAGGAG